MSVPAAVRDEGRDFSLEVSHLSQAFACSAVDRVCGFLLSRCGDGGLSSLRLVRFAFKSRIIVYSLTPRTAIGYVKLSTVVVLGC